MLPCAHKSIRIKRQPSCDRKLFSRIDCGMHSQLQVSMSGLADLGSACLSDFVSCPLSMLCISNTATQLDLMPWQFKAHLHSVQLDECRLHCDPFGPVMLCLHAGQGAAHGRRVPNLTASSPPSPTAATSPTRDPVPPSVAGQTPALVKAET